MPIYQLTCKLIFPLEARGNHLRLSTVGFAVLSVRKSGPTQILTSCYLAVSSVPNDLISDISKVLAEGDTVLTQKGYVELKRQ